MAWDEREIEERYNGGDGIYLPEEYRRIHEHEEDVPPPNCWQVKLSTYGGWAFFILLVLLAAYGILAGAFALKG